MLHLLRRESSKSGFQTAKLEPCPFGNLYDMPVFADESLARDKEIAFNAGSHRELVRLAWEDFVRLVEPKIVRFAAGSIHSTTA